MTIFNTWWLIFLFPPLLIIEIGGLILCVGWLIITIQKKIENDPLRIEYKQILKDIEDERKNN
jgi:hypothetical protein